jgi:transposase
LFFQDEARFGRIDNVCSCWVPPHSRALVGKQIIRQYTYLYGAFCPETGEQFAMILPYANTVCMEIYLEEFSKQFPDYRVVMGMDNASWHSSNISSKLDNIVPLFQPAYSPELNPAENVWHYIRESGHFKNRTFKSMNELEEQLIVATNSLLADRKKIKAITGFRWIKKALEGNMIAV